MLYRIVNAEVFLAKEKLKYRLILQSLYSADLFNLQKHKYSKQLLSFLKHSFENGIPKVETVAIIYLKYIYIVTIWQAWAKEKLKFRLML